MAVEAIAQSITQTAITEVGAGHDPAGADGVLPGQYPAGSLHSCGKGESAPACHADLAAELVDLRRQHVAYDANAVTIRVGNSMLGVLLDLIG